MIAMAFNFHIMQHWQALIIFSDQGWINILGVGRGRCGHPFFFEILCYIYSLPEKIKKYLYSWHVGKCPNNPFLNFLDMPLVMTFFVTFSWKPASWINSSCDFLYQPTVIIPLPVWEVIKPYDWPLSCIGTCHNLVIWGQIVYMNIPIRKDSISENKNNLKMKNII